MSSRSILGYSLLAVVLAACTAEDSLTGEEEGVSTDAAPLSSGEPLRTTTDVNLRSGPSKTNGVLLVVPSGATVTVVNGAPSNGYYNVTYNGTTGWLYGEYVIPANSYPITGDILAAYNRLGGQARFGLPVEASHPGPGGTVQQFQRACIGPDGSGDWNAFSVCELPPDLGPVLANIRQTINARSPRTSVAMGVQWLPTAQRWTEFGDERHVSASSPKWSWAMAALAAQSISAVEPAALPTFIDSNNSAAGKLIDLAGGIDAVNDFTINKLGIPQGSFNLCYWNADHQRFASHCDSSMSGNNFFTPNGVLSFIGKTWQRAVIGRAKGDQLLAWALKSPRSGYGGWLGTQLPAAAQSTMYHKAGWLPPGTTSSDATFNNMNEIGIVTTARGPYAVAILLDHGTDYWGEQKTSMEWASCVVYHAFARDVADPFAAGCVSP